MSTSAAALQFDNELEKFDSSAATTLMQSKHTQSKLNSMFLDTSQFNMSSRDYIPALSKPGALEQFDKLDPNDATSPFRSSNVNLH